MASFSRLDDDLVLNIASYGSPKDLLSLALTCRRLGSKMGAATQRDWRRMARDAKRQKIRLRGWSLMDEAARCIVVKSITKEGAFVPLCHGESWMGRFYELLHPLAFDELFGDDIVASEDKTEVRIEGAYGIGYRSAMSNHIMRAGKHYASFTRTGSHVRVGVFRPTTGVEMEGLEDSYNALLRALNEKWADGHVNYCAVNLSLYSGDAFWGGVPGRHLEFVSEWQDMERFGSNDTAGMLLDLDEGTLSVYKNGRRLGILKSGLAGEYCWGASIPGSHGVSVKISRGPIPEAINF